MNASVIDRDSSPVANRDRCKNGSTITVQNASTLTGRATRRGTERLLTASRKDWGSVMEGLDMIHTPVNHTRSLHIYLGEPSDDFNFFRVEATLFR